jgi:hypothetical protein
MLIYYIQMHLNILFRILNISKFGEYQMLLKNDVYYNIKNTYIIYFENLILDVRF